MNSVGRGSTAESSHFLSEGRVPHVAKGRVVVMGRATVRASRAPRYRGRIVLAALVALAGLTAALSVATPSAHAIGPAPTVSSLSPNSLPQGVASEMVTLTGSNFVSGATVTSHAGITATATFVSSTQLNLLVDVSRTVATGAYNVFVTNPDTSAGSCSNCLTVTVGSFPTIASLSPSALPAGASNQAVTLNGTNLHPRCGGLQSRRHHR